MTDAVSSHDEEAPVGETRSKARSLNNHVILCTASVVMRVLKNRWQSWGLTGATN
jgi:hypothetical protein